MEKKTNTIVVTIAIFIATFMTAIEGTIVSTAMPTIVSDLHGLNIMSWVVSIFLLMTAVSTPVYGKLADTIGRKPIFIFGLVVFILGSALCGLAQNMIMLIIFRVIQGLGAGAIQPVAYTIIADIYPIEKRARVLGLNGSAWGIASIIAPLLGGFIVEQISWHWVFYLNVPIGIITILLMMIFLHEPKRKVNTRIDYLGTTFLVVFLISLMLFLQELGAKSAWMVIGGLMLLMIVSGYLFVKIERKAADPILPIDLLKNREFMGINIVTLLISGFLIGFEFYLPMWMQGILGQPATNAGFAVTPSSIMWIIGSFFAGNLMARFRVQKIMYMSLTFLLIGNIMLLAVPENTPFLFFFFIAAICGFGFGTSITASTVSSQTVVDQDHVGVATSFNSLVRYLGQTMMVAIFGIAFNVAVAAGVQKNNNITQETMNEVVNSTTHKAMNPSVLKTAQNVLFSGLKSVFICSIVVILIAFLVNFLTRPKRDVDKTTVVSN